MNKNSYLYKNTLFYIKILCVVAFIIHAIALTLQGELSVSAKGALAACLPMMKN